MTEEYVTYLYVDSYDQLSEMRAFPSLEEVTAFYRQKCSEEIERQREYRKLYPNYGGYKNHSYFASNRIYEVRAGKEPRIISKKKRLAMIKDL